MQIYKNVFAVVVMVLIATLTASLMMLANDQPLGQTFYIAGLAGLIAGVAGGFRQLRNEEHSAEFQRKERLSARGLFWRVAALSLLFTAGAIYDKDATMTLGVLACVFLVTAAAGFICPSLLKYKRSSSGP